VKEGEALVSYVLIVLFLAMFLLRAFFFFFQVALGYEKHYNVQNPFEWMELISLQVRSTLPPSPPPSLLLPPRTSPTSLSKMSEIFKVPVIMKHPKKASLPPSLSRPSQGKTNFFEKRVGEYQKAGVMSKYNKSGGAGGVAPRTFSTDADF